MAIDFPAQPVQGEIYTDPTSGATWMWNGYAWTRGYSEPPAGIAHPPAETIPVEPPIDGMTSVDAVLRQLSVDLAAVENDNGQKVAKEGGAEGIMTGILTLSEHPTAASGEFQAATKGFVGSIAGLPPGGTFGQTLAINSTGVAGWGNVVDAGNYS
jgi:hypothetical protein